MPANPVIVRDPTQLTMTADPDGTPNVVELCEYTRAVRLQPSADEKDISTFCQTMTELGAVKWSAVLAILWSQEYYEAVKPYVGVDCEFVMKLDAADTKVITWRGKFAFVAMGDFTIGEPVESDWPMAVLEAPDLVDETP